jgi:hypothetical protein
MYVEMLCGGCESHLSLDGDDNESGAWLLVHRFANAHSRCGYMAVAESIGVNEPTRTTSVSPRRRVVKKVRDEEE